MKNQKLPPCSPAINNPSKTKFKYFLDGGERIIPENKIKTPSYKFIFGIYFDNKRIGEIQVKTHDALNARAGGEYSLKEIKQLLLM